MITIESGFYDGETTYFATDNPRTWGDFAEAIDQHIAKNGGLAPTDYTVHTIMQYTTATGPAKAHDMASQIETMAVENLHVLPGSPEPPYMPTYIQPADPEMQAQNFNGVQIIVERQSICPA